MTRIGILTGGGDCPGLNGVIRAATLHARQTYGWEIVGIRNGFEGLYNAAFPGNADQAAVSGAMTDFAIDSTTAFVNQASGEAAEWLAYTTDTLADWQTMANNIAVAATARVDGLVDDYESMISSMAAGIHSFIDDMAAAAEL